MPVFDLDYLVTIIIVIILFAFIIRTKMNLFLSNIRMGCLTLLFNYILYNLYQNVMYYNFIYIEAKNCLDWDPELF